MTGARMFMRKDRLIRLTDGKRGGTVTGDATVDLDSYAWISPSSQLHRGARLEGCARILQYTNAFGPRTVIGGQVWICESWIDNSVIDGFGDITLSRISHSRISVSAAMDLTALNLSEASLYSFADFHRLSIGRYRGAVYRATEGRVLVRVGCQTYDAEGITEEIRDQVMVGFHDRDELDAYERVVREYAAMIRRYGTPND